jgi:hypothetical protein
MHADDTNLDLVLPTDADGRTGMLPGGKDLRL